MMARRKHWVHHYRALQSLGRRWRVTSRRSLVRSSTVRFCAAIYSRANNASAGKGALPLALIWLRLFSPLRPKERVDKTEVHRHFWLRATWNLLYSWPLRRVLVHGLGTNSFAASRSELSLLVRDTTKQLSERLYYHLVVAGRSAKFQLSKSSTPFLKQIFFSRVRFSRGNERSAVSWLSRAFSLRWSLLRGQVWPSREQQPRKAALALTSLTSNRFRVVLERAEILRSRVHDKGGNPDLQSSALEQIWAPAVSGNMRSTAITSAPMHGIPFHSGPVPRDLAHPQFVGMNPQTSGNTAGERAVSNRPAPPQTIQAPQIDLNDLSERIYGQIERKVRMERERRGL
jgi:hypothetical protein